MKTIRKIGFAGLASAALLVLTPSLTVAAPHDEGTAASGENSHNLVHRVSHTLAAAEHYTGSVSSGYKWGNKAPAVESSEIWADSEKPQSGYKWGASSTANNAILSANPSYAKQMRSKWRRDFTEQSRSKWRRDFTEQSRSKWRRDFTEQSRSKWRRDFTEQSRSKWRRDFTEQSRSKWRRNSSEQA